MVNLLCFPFCVFKCTMLLLFVRSVSFLPFVEPRFFRNAKTIKCHMRKTCIILSRSLQPCNYSNAWWKWNCVYYGKSYLLAILDLSNSFNFFFMQTACEKNRKKHQIYSKHHTVCMIKLQWSGIWLSVVVFLACFIYLPYYWLHGTCCCLLFFWLQQNNKLLARFLLTEKSFCAKQFYDYYIFFLLKYFLNFIV